MPPGHDMMMNEDQDMQEDAQDSGQASGKGSVTDMIIGLDQGLTNLIGLMGQAKGLDPSAAEDVQTALDSFRSGIQKMLGKGGMQKADAGVTSMEVGGAKGVKPVM